MGVGVGVSVTTWRLSALPTFSRGETISQTSLQREGQTHKPAFRVAKTVVACASLAKQAARWAAEAHVLLRFRGWDDTKAAAARPRARPPRARFKRKRREAMSAPATGQASDWLSPTPPHVSCKTVISTHARSEGTACSWDEFSILGSSVGPSHHLLRQMQGSVLGTRGRFVPQLLRNSWRRNSQLHILRSGLFPNKRYLSWTVCVDHVRQPSLDEATTLVAQLESCEAGSHCLGADHTQEATCCPTGGSGGTLGTHLRGCQVRGPGLAALGPGSAGFAGCVWGLNDQRVSALARKADG